MQKSGTSSILVLIAALSLGAASSVGLASEQPMARHASSRMDQCNRLQEQFSHAITEHAEAKRAAEAKALQRKAARFCAGKRQAQGIRAYATALKMLGVQPVEP